MLNGINLKEKEKNYRTKRSKIKIDMRDPCNFSKINLFQTNVFLHIDISIKFIIYFVLFRFCFLTRNCPPNLWRISEKLKL